MPQTRTPKGVPTGGQFSGTNHDESELVLVPAEAMVLCPTCQNEVPAWEYADHAESCNDERANMDGFVYPGKVGDTLEAQCEVEAESASEAHESLTYGDASWTNMKLEHGDKYAEDLFDRFDGDLDAASAASDREWGVVLDHLPMGQQEPLRRKLVERDVQPSDFDSKDDDVRMWAGAVRGDVTFGGVITSNGHALSSYEVPDKDDAEALRGRVLAPPVGDVSAVVHKQWHELSTAEQLSYVDGYAAGTSAIRKAREVAARTAPGQRHGWATVTIIDRGPSQRTKEVPGEDDECSLARQAGWHRATDAAVFEDLVASGDFNENHLIKISEGDAVGRGVVVSHVSKLTGMGSANAYEGRIAADARRYNSEGETIPWTEGARIRFTLDQVLGNGVAQ